MSDTILVIGGTGNTGTAVVEALLARRLPVRLLVRDPARLDASEVMYVEGNLDDREALARAMAGVRGVFIAAPVHEQAVQRFRNVIDAARADRVSHVVKISAQGAATDAPAVILRQHAEADRLLAESGLDYTLLKPNAFYQNLLAQAGAIAATGSFYLPAGDARMALVDARDVGEAAASVLAEGGHVGEALTLTGPEALDYATVAQQLGDATGRPITYTPVPVTATEQALRDAGLPGWDARAIAEIQGSFASGDWATPTKDLERLLGRPPVRFAAFAREFRAAFTPDG